MPDVTDTKCDHVSPQMAMSMGVADFLGPWILMPLNDLEAVATANGTAPHPRPIHDGLLSDLVQIRRLFDGAAEKIRRLANHDFEPPLKYDPRDVPPAPNKNPSFGATGLSKMNIFREEVALRNAVTNLSRAFLINEIVSSVALGHYPPLLRFISATVLQRHPGSFEAKHVQFFCNTRVETWMTTYLNLLSLRQRIRAQSDLQFNRFLGMCQFASADFERAVYALGGALHLAGHQSGRHSLPRKTKQVSSEGTLASSQAANAVLQMLHFRGDGFLEMACEIIPKSFESTEYGERWHGSMDGLLEPDEDMPEPTLAKNRKSVQEFAQLALDDFMDFLSYLDYTPNPLSRGLHTTTKASLGENAHARARKSSTSKFKPKIYAVSDLLSESPPDLREVLPEGADSAKDKSACGAATYHPLLGETLYSILLCHAILQTPASRLVRLAHTVAYLHSLCKPFPFTKITRPNAMADWEIVLVGSGNWINMPNLSDGRNKPAPEATSATVDLKSVTGSSICSADATLTIPERRRQRDIVTHAFYLYDGGVLWHIKGPTDLVSQSLRDELPKRPRIIGFWVENAPQPGESKKRKKKKKGKQASTSSA